ncbi:CotH kinase family protein [Haliea sp. AH-315-K21]|uniref:Spore coat protein CotH n=1 Tax=SAR86 cluster bacterium TaxID=2030880 RepID=A0A2A5CIN8_9GAMM|nr:CotH kinase family protein [Haliea sp. AH-315-K21]PCJ43388.1 MAG: hypothetical protein COA71_00510 [SAR86 cluster bacterium]
MKEAEIEQEKMNVNRKRSLWKRMLPVKIRQNMRLIYLSIITIVASSILLGSVQIRPTVFTTGGTLVSTTVEYIEGTVDFFDLSRPHSISLTVDEIQYQRMKNDFLLNGEKSWIVADAIIDGTSIPSVGIRLKGNSTLFPLSGIVAGLPSFENPSTLPMLLSFSEFAEGREYQGRTELAIRSAFAASTTANEALALQLVADSGQVSQKYAFTSFQVNDSPSLTRLVIENPDQGYAESLNLGEGVLYKSRSGNTFSYHGEDPLDYTEDFVQINAIGVRDLSPVIRLLGWLDTVTEEKFDAELENWVDVPSFARYVATHNLLLDWDDMSGPGHNFLLWYDIEDEKFTVVSWDLNQSLSAEGVELGIMLGFGEGGNAKARWGENSLQKYFINSEAFASEIERAHEELQALWFEGERTFEIIDSFAEIVPITDMLNAEEIEADLTALKDFVVDRQVF